MGRFSDLLKTRAPCRGKPPQPQPPPKNETPTSNQNSEDKSGDSSTNGTVWEVVGPVPATDSSGPHLTPDEKIALEQAEIAELQRRAAKLSYTLVPTGVGGGGEKLDTTAKAQEKAEAEAEESYTPEAPDLPEEFPLTSPHFENLLAHFRQTVLEVRFPHLRAKLKHPADKDEQQWAAVCRAVYIIGELGENCQVIAPTGQGKTYFIACTLRILAELYPNKWNPLLTEGRTMPLVIEPPKVILQAQKILAQWGVLAMVTSLASLRASLGDLVLEWRTVIVNQQPVPYPFVRKEVSPLGVFLDESQQVKNCDSTQSVIIESLAAHGIPVIPLSATPYSRVCQGKIISCLLRPEYQLGHAKRRLAPKFWPSFADHCCTGGYSPTEWSPASLRRLQTYLEPFTVRWSIPYPKPVKTRYVSCEFANEQERRIYAEADEEWQRIRAEKGKDPLAGQARYLVALRKFEQTSENLRAKHLVRAAYGLWKKHETDKRKKKISIILGFAFATALDIAQAELEKLIAEDEGLFGKQKPAIVRGGRNCDDDVDNFQSDKRPLLLLTIASGGAGLSLDHNRSNKRQRYMFCSAVWNDIQMAQLAGRTQRLDTQTPSWLYIMYYEGTVELQKLRKVIGKVRCLKEVTSKFNSDARDRQGSFVGDIDTIDRHDAGILETFEAPLDEGEEEALAENIIGSKQRLVFEEGEDEGND